MAFKLNCDQKSFSLSKGWLKTPFQPINYEIKTFKRHGNFMNSAPDVAQQRNSFDSTSGNKLQKIQMSIGVLLVAIAVMGPASAQTAVQQTPTTALTSGARVWVNPPPGDVVRGALLYQALCTSCHAVDGNNIGPSHRGVMGRRVGGLPGYNYSTELGRSRLRWTPQTLNAWLEDPEELVAGQRMGFQVDSLQDRADLIAYLASLK